MHHRIYCTIYVNGSLLRAEPNVAHSNDFSGTLEQVSAHGSPSDTLMSNQYFVSKKSTFHHHQQQRVNAMRLNVLKTLLVSSAIVKNLVCKL